MKIEMFGLKLGEIVTGDKVVNLILQEAGQTAGGIKEGDVLVVTSKIVAKASGLLIELDKIRPSKKASHIARVSGGDPRVIQAVLDNSDAVLFVVPVYQLARKARSLGKISSNEEKAWEALKNTSCELITVTANQPKGNAGLDTSNHPAGIASVPPRNADEIARKFRQEIKEVTGHDVAVVITDTEWFSRLGTLDVAIGASGIQINARKLGAPDRYGKPKYGGVDSIVDEIACAAVLLMGQAAEGVPAVIVRGYIYEKSEEGVSDYPFDPKTSRKIAIEIISCSIRALGLRWLFRPGG
ncbi:MAG: coenzyme F420-0:L-glutamate ligase [Chloroflexi bacterium]|nr:coenzyme F420-0:L-glutamate ligase [Chloroflexota bacterium]